MQRHFTSPTIKEQLVRYDFSFDRVSFLFGSRLLPSVPVSAYAPRRQERHGVPLIRRSDEPTQWLSNATVVGVPNWANVRSTPDDHLQWKRDGLNLVLNTGREYAIQAPWEVIQIWKEETGRTPLWFREGQRKFVTLIFRVSQFDGIDSGLGLPTREFINVKADPHQSDAIRFLGTGNTTLVWGSSAFGVDMRSGSLFEFMSVPRVTLKEIERIWETLCRRWGDDLNPKPLVDPREQQGRFLLGQLQSPALTRDGFLRHLTANGYVLGYEGLSVLLRCPWHPRLKDRATNGPAIYTEPGTDASSWRCPHPSCCGRTTSEVWVKYGYAAPAAENLNVL